MKYRVHLYAIVRVTVENVEADNPQEAFKIAWQEADFNDLFDRNPNGEGPPPTDMRVGSIGFADTHDGAVVDELEGDCLDHDIPGQYGSWGDLLAVCEKVMTLKTGADVGEVFRCVEAALAKAKGTEE